MGNSQCIRGPRVMMKPTVNIIFYFMFEFPCIITLYYIKSQQDATLAVLFISHCKITLHVSEAESVRNM